MKLIAISFHLFCGIGCFAFVITTTVESFPSKCVNWFLEMVRVDMSIILSDFKLWSVIFFNFDKIKEIKECVSVTIKMYTNTQNCGSEAFLFWTVKLLYYNNLCDRNKSILKYANRSFFSLNLVFIEKMKTSLLLYYNTNFILFLFAMDLSVGGYFHSLDLKWRENEDSFKGIYVEEKWMVELNWFTKLNKYLLSPYLRIKSVTR